MLGVCRPPFPFSPEAPTSRCGDGSAHTDWATVPIRVQGDTNFASSTEGKDRRSSLGQQGTNNEGILSEKLENKRKSVKTENLY